MCSIRNNWFGIFKDGRTLEVITYEKDEEVGEFYYED